MNIKRITACTLKDITCIVHFLHPIIDTNHKNYHKPFAHAIRLCEQFASSIRDFYFVIDSCDRGLFPTHVWLFEH